MASSASSITVSLLGDASELTSALTSALIKFEGFKAGVEIVFRGIQSAFEALKNSLDSAAEIQSLATGFQVLLGSSSQAKQLVDGLNQLSASTHLSIDTLGQASQTLLSFGIAGQSIMPDIRMLSEVAGGNALRFQRLSLAFAQTAAAGRLMGQDLLQYVNAGFNPLQEISERTGKSMNALRKEVTAGNISFAQVADAFKTATSAGGRFFGFTEAQAQTWNGLIATLQNRVKQLFINFGTPIIDALSPILRTAIAYTSSLQAAATRLGTAFANVAGTIINAFNSGDLSSIIGLSLMVGIKEAVNYLAGGLYTAGQLFGNLIIADLRAAFDPKVIAGIIEVIGGLNLILGGAAITFGAGILDGLKSPIEYLIASCKFAAESFVDILTGRLPRSFAAVFAEVQKSNPVGNAADAARALGRDAVADGTRVVGQGANDIINAASTQKSVEEIMATIKSFKPINIFDTKDEEDKLKALIAKNLYAAKAAAGTERAMTDAGSADATGAGGKGRAYGAKGDSLTEIGGGGGFSRSESPLLDAQNQANDILAKIESNTNKSETPAVAGNAFTNKYGNRIDPVELLPGGDYDSSINPRAPTLPTAPGVGGLPFMGMYSMLGQMPQPSADKSGDVINVLEKIHASIEAQKTVPLPSTGMLGFSTF